MQGVKSGINPYLLINSIITYPMRHLVTPEDFAANESFQRWVLNCKETDDRFWRRWVGEHPEKQFVVDEARQLVCSFRFEEHRPSEGQAQVVWERIQAQTLSNPRKVILFSRPFLGKIAAAISLLVIGAAIWTLYAPSYKTYTTNYGEMLEIQLPDGSQVILNANSTLRHNTNWNREDTSRQVWLEGEAFFTVTKQPVDSNSSSLSKFVVHTDELEVEVLGTAFNVNTHRNTTQVILEHGQVRLHLPHQSAEQNLLMLPGDVVAYSEQGDVLIQEKVSTEALTSWKENELIFQDQPLYEIAARLQNTYGYQIIFEDDSIAHEKFTISIPADDVELLFPMLSRSLSLKMKRDDHQISFSYD